MPRASEAMDLLWDLVPDEMKKLESVCICIFQSLLSTVPVTVFFVVGLES